MMEYDLINPSDGYTFLAADRETAALVVFLLGPMYSAEPKEGEENVPIFIFGGADEWYRDTFGRSPDEGADALRKEVADALCSMMYGGFETRRRYEAELEAITDEEKRQKFIEEWQDGHTSLNDIGTYCHTLGEKLRTRIEREDRE